MRFRGYPCWLFLCLLLLFCLPVFAESPIVVKIVIVTMYEQGADIGDAPGEFQYWVEREHLDKIFPFPAGNHDLRMNSNGVLGVLTGVGTAKAASTIMALGLDPRFDLTHAYWIVAGIAGGNPANVSLGSAVWVHGSSMAISRTKSMLGRFLRIGQRGYVPLSKSTPYEQPVNTDLNEAYELNDSLLQWAYQLTRNIPLEDDATIAERRSHFTQATAKKPPFIFIGDDLSASTFWHGAKMDAWAMSGSATTPEAKEILQSPEWRTQAHYNR